MVTLRWIDGPVLRGFHRTRLVPTGLDMPGTRTLTRSRTPCLMPSRVKTFGGWKVNRRSGVPSGDESSCRVGGPYGTEALRGHVEPGSFGVDDVFRKTYPSAVSITVAPIVCPRCEASTTSVSEVTGAISSSLSSGSLPRPFPTDSRDSSLDSPRGGALHVGDPCRTGVLRTPSRSSGV